MDTIGTMSPWGKQELINFLRDPDTDFKTTLAALSETVYLNGRVAVWRMPRSMILGKAELLAVVESLPDPATQHPGGIV